VVFWTISTIKYEKSAAKFHYINNILISEHKGTDPHWKQLHCTHFTS